MNAARDVIARIIADVYDDAIGCGDVPPAAPDERSDDYWADAILAALGVDDGPIAITAPDQPVRRIAEVKLVDIYGAGSEWHAVLGHEVEL